MIETAAENRAASNHPLSYKVLNATKLLEMMPTHEATALTPEELEQCKGNGANELMPSTYTKVFSNAALHWYVSNYLLPKLCDIWNKAADKE